MARTGMADLITKARMMSAAGTADYTIAGVTYWTDDQIQARLDERKTTHWQVDLRPIGEVTNGTTNYYHYLFPDYIGRWFEGTASGNWRVNDSVGSAAPAYSVDFDARIITFSADTGGTAYYADVDSYDLYRAVSQIWESKAAYAAGAVDWSSDNHRVSASQEYHQCMNMAKRYRDLSPSSMQTTQLVRTDENGPRGWWG